MVLLAHTYFASSSIVVMAILFAARDWDAQNNDRIDASVFEAFGFAYMDDSFGVALLPMAVVTVLTALTQSIPLLILVGMLMVISSAVVIGWVRNPVWVVRFEEDVAWVQNVHPSILERDSIPVWEEQDWSW